MTEKTRFMSAHGGWGSGKTWLLHTMPGPRLIFDTEGGFEDVEVPLKLWNPLEEPCPDADDNESVVIDVTTLAQIKEGMRVLKTGDHPFLSFGMDSLTEGQKQLKTQVSNTKGLDYDPDAVFDQQAWGRLLNNAELLIRDMRDLTRPTSKKRMHGMIVMGSDLESAPIRPLLQGALRKHMAGFVRLDGYLFNTIDTKGAFGPEGEIIRVMNINDAHGAVAKCNMHKVNEHYKNSGNGYQIVNPNMAEILAIANS